jgi:alpha-L-fucosidase
MAFDEDSGTRWATDNGTKRSWIAASFASSQTVGSVSISEYLDRVQKFEFQYRAGADWKTIFTGSKIGGQFHQKFAPVTAREFRLNILDATEGPTINEIKLMPD